MEISDICNNYTLLLCITVVIVIIIAKMYNRCGDTGTAKVGTNNINKGPTQRVSDNSKIIMYGTDSCPWCKRQKTELKDVWDTVNYINCEESSGGCANIEALPTWEINGKRTEGFMKKDEFVRQCAA